MGNDIRSEAEAEIQVRRYVTIKEAAELTGMSTTTIARRAKLGDFPNAYKEVMPHEGQGRWLISMEDLQAAGLPLITDLEADAAGAAKLRIQLRYWKSRALEAEHLLEEKWES